MATKVAYHVVPCGTLVMTAKNNRVILSGISADCVAVGTYVIEESRESEAARGAEVIATTPQIDKIR